MHKLVKCSWDICSPLISEEVKQTAETLNELCNLLHSAELQMNSLKKGKCWNEIIRGKPHDNSSYLIKISNSDSCSKPSNFSVSLFWLSFYLVKVTFNVPSV